MGFFSLKHNPFKNMVNEIRKEVSKDIHKVEKVVDVAKKDVGKGISAIEKVNRELADPNNIDRFGNIAEKGGAALATIGVATAQPELIGLGAAIGSVGVIAKGAAGVGHGVQKFKEGKPIEGLGDMLGGVAGIGEVGDFSGKNTAKDIAKLTKDIGKQLDPIIIKQKKISKTQQDIRKMELETLGELETVKITEENIIGDIKNVQKQETKEFSMLERQQQDLQNDLLKSQVDEQHFEQKITQQVERDEQQLLNVIDDLSERLEESFIKEFDFDSMSSLMVRLEVDDILPFLARNIKDFNKMSESDQDKILDIAISKGL